MESVTYVCYSKEDLAAQEKTHTDELQSIKEALLKVAENDVNAGTLEEIKALLGMTEESSQDMPTTASKADSASETATPATDTKSTENTVTEPSKASEPTVPNTVTVQPGDTLQTIAEKTGTNPRHLIDMNMLMEPVVLRPGQALKF